LLAHQRIDLFEALAWSTVNVQRFLCQTHYSGRKIGHNHRYVSGAHIHTDDITSIWINFQNDGFSSVGIVVFYFANHIMLCQVVDDGGNRSTGQPHFSGQFHSRNSTRRKSN